MNLHIEYGARFCALLLPLTVGCASMHDSFSSTEHNAALDRLGAAHQNEQETEGQNKVLQEQGALAVQPVDVEQARVKARATDETSQGEKAEEQQREAEQETKLELAKVERDAAQRELEIFEENGPEADSTQKSEPDQK